MVRSYINSFSLLLGEMSHIHSIYIDLSLLILLLQYQLVTQYIKHTTVLLVPGHIRKIHSFFKIAFTT